MGFFSFRKNFFRTTRQREKKIIQNLTLGYMTKTLDQIFFFSSTKIRIFFQQHWESEYFFRKKTIAPPPWKLNGPSLIYTC